METKTIFLIGMLCTFIVACSEERILDDQASTLKALTVKVEDGNSLNSKIDKVRMATNVYSCEKCGVDFPTYSLAEGNFTNGGFMIPLPTSSEMQSLIDKIQSQMNGNEWRFDRLSIPEDVSVSNPNVRTAAITIVASKSGEEVGIFTYENRNKNIGGEIIYAERDVIITGTSSDTEDGITYYYEYNLSLKKGWNFVYGILTSATSKTINVLITTTDPGSMKWYFEEY